MIVPHAAAARLLPGWVEPAEVFAGIADDDAFWLDAGLDASSGWSWVGTGTPAGRPDPSMTPTIDAAGSSRDGGPFRGGWVGWCGYDSAAARAGAPAAADPDAAPELWLRVDELVAFDHGTRHVWIVAPPERLDAFAVAVREWRGAARTGLPQPPRRTASARTPPDDYARLIAECRAAIRRGDAYQLCLTTRFHVPDDGAPIDPLAVFLRLRDAASAHHGGLIRSGGTALVSASPERFVQVSDGTVRSSPIKGTRPRAVDPVADARLAADLVTSAKERAENVMIVDLVRNDLQRVCEVGSVTVERLLEVESYPTVHQLVSTVAGRLRRGIRFDDVLASTFPAGSMTGAPKLSAMAILHRLEGAPRGVYAGCFGWVGTGGDLDLAMVIRSVVVHPGGAYVGAGGGITWGSIAADEVAEVALKARAPLAALGAELPPRWAEHVR